MKPAAHFFTKEEEKALVQAISEAEKQTSGEIRIHLAGKCEGNELDEAARIFTRLGMEKTAERNGILIYIAVESRKMAVIGDKGIHEKVGQEFWEKLTQKIISEFTAGNKAEVLCESIIACGKALALYFPRLPDDKNELSNEISS
jgi:uncharacterized membrane protein